MHHDLSQEVTRLRPAGKTFGLALMVLGVVGILAAFLTGGADGHRRFWFAYLFGLASIACVSSASLIFTVVNHLVRAGWITNVRRVLETMGLQMGLVLILALPVVGTVLTRNGTIYSWARPGDTPVVSHEEGEAQESPHHGGAVPEGEGHPGEMKPAEGESHVVEAAGGTIDTHAFEGKGENIAPERVQPDVAAVYPNEQVRPGVERDFDENIARKNHGWLNPFFWSFRVLAYLGLMFGIAYYYWSGSVRQDATGDIDISDRLSYNAGPLTIACALLTTFIAFDMFMALDPHWFSTMYGIYFFASGTQAMWAILALFVLVFQRRGYLRQSISTEHRHDLGKFLWAFIFFWGYVGFSQYMLQWYANLPEETFWFDKRGYSQSHPNAYTPLVIALVAGRFVIPFLGLVSRHVKRNRFGLGFWAVWLLCFWVVDMYLLVIPEYKWISRGDSLLLGVPEIGGFVGVVGLWLGNVIRVLGNHELRPVRDPRVHESLALQNF